MTSIPATAPPMGRVSTAAAPRSTSILTASSLNSPNPSGRIPSISGATASVSKRLTNTKSVRATTSALWRSRLLTKVPRKALVFHGSLLYFGFMLKKPEAQQQELEMVSVGSSVPSGHLLRKIDGAVDFEFIRERVRHLYCENNGRPALDPVVLFKLLFIGYLFGIRSERQLMREVQVNAAYRWFLRLRLQDKVPDASTLSQTRRRRFLESDIYQQIFDEIVELACRKGLVIGRGALHRLNPSEGQRQQEEVRRAAC